MPDVTYVRMPQADYVAICDATRAKTGEAGTLTSGQVATKINNLVTVDDVDIVNCGTSTTVND